MAANEGSTHTHPVIWEHEWTFELESATGVVAQGELSFIQKCAREIAIASKDMGSFKFYTGRGLSFPARIGRLVRLRQMAIEAERKGKYVRADFLWQQAQSRLFEVVKCVSAWQEFIAEVSNRYGILQDAAAADQIRKSFVRELFLDTHWALYNGLRSITASPDPCHRCFIHLNYIRQLKRLCADFSFSDDSESLLDTKRELDAMRAGKQWHEAWKLAREMAKRFPDEEEFVHLAADIQLSATFDGLINAESQTALSKNAEKINEGIEALNILRNRAPYNLFVLNSLADLHHLRAIMLAKAGDLSDALLEIEKAVACHPGVEEFQNTREQLITQMQELQAQMAEIEERLRATPNATLNTEGMQMRYEARTGFSLMNDFAESKTVTKLRDERRKALALSIWKEIGFDKLKIEDPLILSLLAGLETVAAQEPISEQEIRNLWATTVGDHPELSSLDPDAVASFLTNRLLKEATVPETPEQPEPKEQKQAPEPIIVPETDKKRFSLEPFLLWFFSGQSMWVKAELVLALVLVCCLAVLATHEAVNRPVRNSIYPQILQAFAQQDYVNVMDNAERFLTTSTIVPDPRQEEVKNLYSEAIVRWLLLEDATAEKIQRYSMRFREILGTSDRISKEEQK